MLAKFKQRLRSPQEAPVLDGISLLPSEILGGEIFPLVVHEENYGDLWHRKLLVLARVCTQWRNIVHSTPFLWSHIAINTRQFSGVGRFRRNRFTKKYFEALRMCLARSAPLPVSISIDDGLVFPGDRKDFARAVDLISNAAVRMEVLRINSRRRDDAGVGILRALELILTGAFQALTEIDFVFPSDVALVPFSVMSAPHLRRVKLNAGPDPLKFMSIPWPQLTHLTLAAPPLTCLAVLARCSNLVSAVLHHMYISLPDGNAPTTATLVHLTSLRLTVSSTLIEAVGNLVLPALTMLELICDEEDMIRVWPPLKVFRQLPLHNIQCLMFERFPLVSATLCALLRCTPSVTELKLKGRDCIDNALLNALRADVYWSKPLLPQLEMLSIDWGSVLGDDFDLETLQVMLASRVGVGLRRIVYRGYYHGQVPALVACHVDGLQVDVSGVKRIIFI
ncbi:hypothetical protein C8F04DRAFT_1067255 [Mycena alexandri]|uniref:F-box domain-containing protein n=1 Tax=Mycena alexandri TaxID=1745969 RepID=A0AAD6TH67_9AGAR|nr:hypothetical protein C8F04DRAFT_1067255 [Mycena alexandri]